MVRRHANLGKALEDLIIYVNQQYRAQRRALITKVPTEFIPLRKGKHIVGAKVEQKAVVDFIGNYGGRPIAFDAKSTRDKKIYWRVLEPHQAKYLDDNWKFGGISFILVGFSSMPNFPLFVVPWVIWKEHALRWTKGSGVAGLKPEEMSKLWAVQGHDYLSTIDRIWLQVD